jgi:hypothetical protein
MTTRRSVLAGLALVLCACTEPPLPPTQRRAPAPLTFDAARLLWAETKASCPKYHFALVESKSDDVEERTSFEITDDRPTARMVLRLRSRGDGTREIEENWVETATELGIHESGKLPRTMEQLYDDCERDILSRDSAKNMITLGYDGQGALVECVSYPLDNCHFLCVEGDYVQDFGCGPLDTTLIRP